MTEGSSYTGDAARLVVVTALALALALAVNAVLGALIGPPAALVGLP